jgi:hypothetical protein
MLCVAVCVLWVRSYHVADAWTWDRLGARVILASANGQLWWERIRWSTGAGVTLAGRPGYGATPPNAVRLEDKLPPSRELGGFRWTYEDWDPRTPGAIVFELLAIPNWWIAVATAILPGLALLARWRRRRRTLPGLCPHCGYDLRATPDRCPECGAIPAGHA